MSPLKPLEHVDEIRDLLYGPGRGRPRAARCEPARGGAGVSSVLWETCTGCGREYAWPHLCRAHLLCGICHPTEEDPRA